MKTYRFYFIDSDNNVLTEKTFDCFDAKEAIKLADKLFAETMQNDCVSVTFSEA